MIRKFLFTNSRSYLIFFIILAVISDNLLAASAKESTKECSICHYEWVDVFMYQMRSTEIAKIPKDRQVANDKMCFSCHDGSVVDSRIRVWAKNNIHKINVKPPSGMNIPNQLPLDDGKINCRTCHTAHGTNDRHINGKVNTVFLRVENKNSELCKLCHYKNIGVRNHPEKPVKFTNKIKKYVKFGTKDEVICESCHTPHGSNYDKILVNDIFYICGDCHLDKIKDGKYVNGILVHPSNINIDKVNYDSNEVKVINGILTCVSCHSPHHAKGEKLLAVDNKNDKLCLICHESKKTVYYSKHNLKKKKSINSGESSNVCQFCHKPHGWQQSIDNNYSDIYTAVCMSCHTKIEMVDNRLIDYKKYNHPVMVEVKNNIKLPLYEKSDYLSSKNKGKYVTCFTCHDVHSKKTNFLRMDTNNNELCIECHKDKVNILNTKHGIDKVKCISCHKIHNAEDKKLIRDGLNNEGCFNCHVENKMAGKSIIGDNSHPVNKIVKIDIPDNLKLKDGKLVCTTCHNPHSDIKGKFLRIDKNKICSNCHKEQANIINSKHDFYDQSMDYCNKCHLVHNAKSDNRIYSYTVNNKNDLCVVCHNYEGLTKKATPNMLHPEKRLNKSKVSFKNDFINCTDCHDPHNNGPKKNHETKFKTSFLKHRKMGIILYCSPKTVDKLGV